jgi:hypothetical protein
MLILYAAELQIRQDEEFPPPRSAQAGGCAGGAGRQMMPRDFISRYLLITSAVS